MFQTMIGMFMTPGTVGKDVLYEGQVSQSSASVVVLKEQRSVRPECKFSSF